MKEQRSLQQTAVVVDSTPVPSSSSSARYPERVAQAESQYIRSTKEMIMSAGVFLVGLTLLFGVTTAVIGAWHQYIETMSWLLKGIVIIGSYAVPVIFIYVGISSVVRDIYRARRATEDLRQMEDQRKRDNILADAEVEKMQAEAERIRAEAEKIRRTIDFDGIGNAAVLDPRSYQVTVVRGNYHEYPSLSSLHYHNAISGGTKPDEKQAMLTTPLQFPAPRDFADVLQSFRPSKSEIYLADGVEKPIVSGMYELCHVGLGGPTGGGKTNTTRLIVAQLLSADAQVYFATPNFAQVKLNGRRLEDWRPIVARLAAPPAREEEDIRKLLQGFKALFENRKREEDRTPRRPKDVFLVLGEWPGIVARVEEAPEILELLLREARQYGVHVITEMQDALVQTIGLSSGARENLRTGVYFGGDLNTAKVLLGLKKGEKVDETGLGQKGAVYIRTFSDAPRPGRIPFFSNQSLYMLLGAPPDPMPDCTIENEDEIPESYCRVIDGRYIDDGSQVVVESDEGESVTRQHTRMSGQISAPGQGSMTREDDLLGTLPDETEGTSNYAKMSAMQTSMFIAGYRERPNIDEVLKTIQGVSTKHRQHARELIKKHKLDK